MNSSTLLVLCDDEDRAGRLRNVLNHYFPAATLDTLHVNNKYYHCQVGIRTDSLAHPVSAHPPELLVFLVDDLHADISHFDALIEKYSPENYMVVVDSQQAETPLAQRVMNECNNFIQVVLEDLATAAQRKPMWKGCQLLSEEPEGGIFSLCELVETTQWRDAVRHPHSKQAPKHQKGMPVETKLEVETEDKLEAKSQIVPSSPFEPQEYTGEEGEEQFQKLFMDMMAFKGRMESNPERQGNDAERKRIAEEFIMRLSKDLMHD